MRVKLIRDYDAFAALKPEWDAMLADSPFQAPFYSWNWYEAWWNGFGGQSQLFTIAVEDDCGRLQVLAPFLQTRGSVRGLAVREVRFIGHSITPHNGIFFRNGWSGEEAISTVLACLAEHRGLWDIVNLWNIPDNASYLAPLEEAGLQCGLHRLQGPGMRSASVDLNGSFESYMSDGPRKSRKRGIVQKVRQLSQRPGYRLVDLSKPGDVPQAMELAFAVSKSSWKGRLGTDMSGWDARRAFYARVTPRLAEAGQLRIWVAMLDDVPIALEYHIIAGDRAYFIVNDFNDAYQKLSPGTVLLYQVLENLFREKTLREFCFSGDLYDYKTIWATGVRHHVNLEMFHNRPYSRFLWWTKNQVLPALRSIKAKFWAGGEDQPTVGPSSHACY